MRDGPRGLTLERGATQNPNAIQKTMRSGKFIPMLLPCLALVGAGWCGGPRALLAQEEPEARPEGPPPIVGIAHIALKTSNLKAARDFYSGLLGFDELPAPTAGGEPAPAVFKVNDHQYIELFPGLKSPADDRLVHIAFETPDPPAVRYRLAEGRVFVPKHVWTDGNGDLGFTIKDADGHAVEFMRYWPGSRESRYFGKFLGAHRISDHMIHCGLIIRDRAGADLLYRKLLGFRDIWHGGMTDERTDWVDMRVSDGTDWLEYMLNVGENPSAHTLGVMHHLALGVPSVAAAYHTLIERGLKTTEKPQIGRDGKWQLNLYDPDGTRVELMEPRPVRTPCCSPMLDDGPPRE
jgi:catechol 2,3-dioxygenase-like lactoylglutathione lyase family enzyme